MIEGLLLACAIIMVMQAILAFAYTQKLYTYYMNELNELEKL